MPYQNGMIPRPKLIFSRGAEGDIFFPPVPSLGQPDSAPAQDSGKRYWLVFDSAPREVSSGKLSHAISERYDSKAKVNLLSRRTGWYIVFFYYFKTDSPSAQARTRTQDPKRPPEGHQWTTFASDVRIGSFFFWNIKNPAAQKVIYFL